MIKLPILTLPRALPRWPTALTLCVVATLSTPWVHAEKADRDKPLNVEADQQSRFDMQNQVVVFNGNVVVTKGTIAIRADRIEVRETREGQHIAIATANGGKLASFRQKRDGVDETIEGQAERLEYDSKADLVRFLGNAQVRRLRGTALADEVTGALITYDNAAEVFSVSGAGASSSTNNGAATPPGRVRAVLTPRGASAPSAAASATAAPVSPAGSAPAAPTAARPGETR